MTGLKLNYFKLFRVFTAPQITNCHQRNADKVGIQARVDKAEAAEEEQAALQEAKMAGKVRAHCRSNANHAQNSRAAREYNAERSSVNHQNFRRQYKDVRNDECRNSQFGSVDTGTQLPEQPAG